MIRSILLLIFFYSLISLILPLGKSKNVILMLVISIIVCSILSMISKAEFKIPDFEASPIPSAEFSPERIALENYLSTEIERITGSPPVTIETDMEKTEQGLTLTELWIRIGSGNPEEVERELRQVFPGKQITVCRAEGSGHDENSCLDS